VLIGIDDVATGVGKEAADGGDQTGPIGAGKQQARSGDLAGDGGMIAGLLAGSLSIVEAGTCDSRLGWCVYARTMWTL
jgi:hypothetical protein